jgi:hypothetical protein
MFVSLTVSLLGMAALTTSRIHRRMNEAGTDAAAARLYAQAALRMGMLRLEQNPNWRFTYAHGVWESNVTIGDGAYTLAGLDPSDSDLADQPEDPVILVGTGRCGGATHKMQITLCPVNRGYSVLKTAIYSGNDLKLNAATLNCDQTAAANHDADGTGGSAFNCDVEVVNNLKGGVYNGDAQAGVAPRTQPDPAKVFDFYLAHGTWIDKSALPQGYANVVKNPGFENAANDWQAANCTLLDDTGNVHSGLHAVRVASRTANTAGPEQDVTNLLDRGVAYDASAWIHGLTTDDRRYFLRLTLVSTGSGTAIMTSGETKAKASDGWKQISHAMTPTWTGALISAKLQLITAAGELDDFLADDFSLKEVGTDRNISRVVLSPQSNPFGATTNPRGIYIIDLDDTKLFIKYARIIGTLVLLKPKAGSAIGAGGPVLWEPAVPGFPALLVRDKEMLINPSNAGLNEYANGINLNPPGAPYSGVVDADQSDIYPSQINGLIYGTHTLKFANQTRVNGLVLSADNIEISDTLNANYNSGYFFNPPPGFLAPEQIRILLDSVAKPLN